MVDNDKLAQGLVDELLLVQPWSSTSRVSIKTVKAIVRVLINLSDAQSILEELKKLREKGGEAEQKCMQ